MRRSELAEGVAGKTGLSKRESQAAVEAVFQVLAEGLAQGKQMRVSGFGTFEAKPREERTVRNPRTGEALTLPSAMVPRFRPSPALKEKVNEKQKGDLETS